MGSLKKRSHITKFNPIFQPIILVRYSVHLLADPFAPEFYSPIQNNISSNFGDALNFVICEHFFVLAKATSLPHGFIENPI